MKKFLLSACTFFVALAAIAQVPGTLSWSSPLSPASEAAALYRRAPLAVTADGSVLATGNFDQSITIGTTTLEPIATSAYVAKYSDKGVALWAVALRGAATITTIDADAEGNVFVAGTFADEVVVGSTDAATKTIKGKEGVNVKVSAFMAKYNAEGKLQSVRTFLPTVGEPPLTGEMMYTPEADAVFVRPGKLQVSEGKVYLSVFFAGNVKEDAVEWSARYLNVFDFMAQDLTSAGILSLNATDLSAATSVALFQNEEVLSNVDIRTEDANFVVEGGKMYAAFVGAGKKALTTAIGTEKFAFTVDAEGKQDHAFVLAAIGETTTTKVFNNEAHSELYSTDLVRAMAIKGDNLYLGGTFFNKLPFKTEIASQGAADIFVAALNKNDLSVQWATANGLNEGDANQVQEVMTGMLVKKDGVFVTGYTEKKSDRTVAGTLSFNFTEAAATDAGETRLVGATATNGTLFAANFIADLNTNLSVFNVANETRVSAIVATEGAATSVYTLDGKRVADENTLPAGIYLVKTGDAVRKLMVK